MTRTKIKREASIAENQKNEKIIKRGEKMKYQPFEEQKFWGDTWAIVLARIMSTTHEEEKVLGRQVNSF
jgi:hypothetical protein